MAEQPDWQPISRLPLIGSMIDGMLRDAEEHYQILLHASPRPHVLGASGEALRHFAALAREQPLSEAARRLEVDRATLARRVAVLTGASTVRASHGEQIHGLKTCYNLSTLINALKQREDHTPVTFRSGRLGFKNRDAQAELIARTNRLEPTHLIDTR